MKKDYSTTRLLNERKPEVANDPRSRIVSALFLVDSGRRQGEGGVRTKGLFKSPGEEKPVVTVVTVVFNGADCIEDTILSVLNQSYENLEFIIIDGGSTDGTVDLIKKYDQAVDYWLSEPDDGIYDAMNKGVMLATGEWINFMNAGDVFSEDGVVSSIFSCIENYSEVDFIYSDILFGYRSGLRLFPCDIEKRVVVHQSVIYRRAIHHCFGYYAVAKGMTISDYLFFMANREKKWSKVATAICIYNPYGVSAGLGTYRQKVAVDVMLGLRGRVAGAVLLVLHPLYAAIKRILQVCGILPG